MSDTEGPFYYKKRSQKQHFNSSNLGVASAASAALLITTTGCTLPSGSNNNSGLTEKIIPKNDKKIDQKEFQRISLWNKHTMSSKIDFSEVQPSTSQNFYLNVPKTSYFAQTSSAPVTPQNNSRGPSPSIYSSTTPNVVINDILQKRRGSVSSPLLNFSRELKEFRKRSISEISLILEIIKSAANSEQSNQLRRNTKFNIGDRRPSLSTGNLLIPPNNSNFPSSLSLSRISSFIRHKNITKMRWQQRLSPNNIQKQMGIGKL